MLLLHLAPTPTEAAQSVTGSWTIHPQVQRGTVALSLEIDDGRTGSHDQDMHDLPANAIGITQQELDAQSSAVSFAIVRDAGTIAGKGTLSRGSGGGTFTLTPNASFEAALHGRGDDVAPGDLLGLAMLDVTIAYVDEIASAGYPHLELAQLLAFRALGVDGAYVHDLRTTFATADLDAGELTSLRALHVTGDFVRSLRNAGVAITRPDEAVQLRALGIDRDYVRRVEAHGIVHPSVDQLVKLKALNIVIAQPREAAA
jgi:hypothetical protein